MFPFPFKTANFPMSSDLWESPDYTILPMGRFAAEEEARIAALAVPPEEAGFSLGTILLLGGAALLFLVPKKKRR